jgi:hypothetical protein
MHHNQGHYYNGQQTVITHTHAALHVGIVNQQVLDKPAINQQALDKPASIPYYPIILDGMSPSYLNTLYRNSRDGAAPSCHVTHSNPGFIKGRPLSGCCSPVLMFLYECLQALGARSTLLQAGNGLPGWRH